MAVSNLSDDLSPNYSSISSFSSTKEQFDSLSSLTASSTTASFLSTSFSSTPSNNSKFNHTSCGSDFSSSSVQMSKSDKVTWSDEVHEAFLLSCKNTLKNYTVRRDLERRVRSGTGTEEKGRNVGCCDPAKSIAENNSCKHTNKCSNKEDSKKDKNKSDSKNEEKEKKEKEEANIPLYVFKKDENDNLGVLMDEWTSDEKINEILPFVAEKASCIYFSVIKKGLAEGMTLANEDEEKQLRSDILKETLIRQIQNNIAKQVMDERCMDSHEGGLFANPVCYTDGPLDCLKPETIRNLMIDGVAVQENFLGEDLRKKIYEETELLEYDNKFNEILSLCIQGIRNDHMWWVSSSDLDREKQSGLLHLFKKMSELPFELNKKGNLGLQTAWVFQMSYYQNSGAYYKRHLDGGYSKSSNNGRKITAIYYPNPVAWKESDGGILRVYKRQSMSYQEKKKNRDEQLKEKEDDSYIDILPKGDSLVLFRSRDMPHEVTPTYRKRFAITLWMSGPPGPGDKET